MSDYDTAYDELPDCCCKGAEENRKLKRDNKKLREMLAEFIKQYEPVLEEDMPEHHDRVVVMAFQDMHEEAKELLK